METAWLHTPIGWLELKGDERGLASVFFNEPTTDGFSKRTPQVLQPALTQLREYFEGARTNFELTLHPEGSEFQKRVWQQLGTIPYGRTVSYQHVANQLGNPRVIRAAASANGKNPISIIIPCHRVIGSDGSLTGYAGGLPRKKWLLQHESQAPQQALF